MTDTGLWTLDQFAEQVAAALAVVDYDGPPSGRVRDVPDRRAIRWYTTIGLVDRPAAMRGRTALYGPRHLLQVVAIKRRQADGRSLAQIQVELAGVTDATLKSIARLPSEALTAGATPASPSPSQSPAERALVRPRFWAGAAPAMASGSPPAAPLSDTSLPAASPPVVPPLVVSPPDGDRLDAAPLAAAAELLAGIRLTAGVTLLLDRIPDPAEIPSIHAAAAPLLDLLSRRGLTAHSPGWDAHYRGDSHEDPDPAVE